MSTQEDASDDSGSSDSAVLQAGAGFVDITPAPGTPLAGSVGVLRPAQTFRDPLYARAVVFQSGARRLCILALDVTIITRAYADAIRNAITQRFDFDSDAVLIHATQTHSAPGVGGFLLDDDFPLSAQWNWVRLLDVAFSEMVVSRAVEAVAQAMENLQPAQIGVGSGLEGRVGFNRRAVMRNGQVGMPGPTWNSWIPPTQIRYLEGPGDPELGVLAVRDANGKMRALLLSYTCHPVHLFLESGGIVSADWPGAWIGEMRATCGDCVPIVLNGACGNVNPWNPFDPDFQPDQDRAGQILAQTTRQVLETLEYSSQAQLAWRARRLKLPLRAPQPAQLEAARARLESQPEPVYAEGSDSELDWQWMQAAQTMSVHLQHARDGGILDYEVQVFRIGDCAWVGLPGEPFAEGGLQIKLASPAAQTYIVHCTSHYAGYIPTREAFARGGHEVNLSYWAKVAPEALEMIVEAAGELLRELFV